MRVLMTIKMDTEKANKAIADDKLSQVMQPIERLKPEAVFFGALDGKRTGFVVFDLENTSDIPSIAEPFFQELKAEIDFTPVMSIEEVQSGLQKYASH